MWATGMHILLLDRIKSFIHIFSKGITTIISSLFHFLLILNSENFCLSWPFRILSICNQYTTCTIRLYNAYRCFEHCAVSVLWFQSVFGDKLVMSLLFESDFCEDPQLPSPCQLKHKILVKNKKIRDFDTYPLKKVRFKVFFVYLIMFYFSLPNFYWFWGFFCVQVFLDISKCFSLCNRCPLALEPTAWLL